MHFFLTTPGGELDIQEQDFLEQQGHEGQQAWGRVKTTATLGHHTYKAKNLKAAKSGTDPEVMIDP